MSQPVELLSVRRRLWRHGRPITRANGDGRCLQSLHWLPGWGQCRLNDDDAAEVSYSTKRTQFISIAVFRQQASSSG